MAGGTFTEQNKIRPGAYINFVNEPAPTGKISERGIVTMGLSLGWGTSKTVITVDRSTNFPEVLGYDLSAPPLLLVKESLKRAKTLLLYRLNEGTKATATSGSLTVTAQYGGVRGNDLAIRVQPNIDAADKFDVQTLLAGEVEDTQTVADISGLVPNTWVVFSGTGSLSSTAGVPLEGGSDGTVINQDHSDYLAAIEVFDFNTIALNAADDGLKALYVAFVKRLRDVEGKKVQGVLENYPTADSEGILSVKNGVILQDGTVLTSAQATAWVAGATAAARANESLTYQAYDEAEDVSPRYTNSQIEAALQNGEIVFTQSNNRAIVEQDINTLTEFTPEKGKQFAKNRVIRVLDGIANDFKTIFETYYIGKVNNNADGRNIFRNECINYLTQLQNGNAIQNFDGQKDVNVVSGSEADSVYVEVSVQPVDAIEKIYMKVQVD